MTKHDRTGHDAAKPDIPYVHQLRGELVRAVAREQRVESSERAVDARKGRMTMRRPLILAVAAGVVLVAGAIAGVALVAGSDDDSGGKLAVQPTDESPSPVDPSEPPDDGGMMGICIELTAETLAMSEVAFDGTVTANEPGAGPDGQTVVTFDVNRWYRGNSGSSLTLMTWAGSDMIIEDGGDLDLSVGSRVLGTAVGKDLNGCGFSMPYTEENAELFADAFGA